MKDEIVWVYVESINEILELTCGSIGEIKNIYGINSTGKEVQVITVDEVLFLA